MKNAIKFLGGYLLFSLIFYTIFSICVLGTSILIFTIANALFPLPDWADGATLLVVTGIYVYILVVYHVRIDIQMQNKTIFNYENRGGKR
jgi:hypothetical protein